MTPDNPIILPGTTQQFAAIGKFPVKPTDDITGEVTWVSSNTRVATVNSDGLARALAPGTTIITATAGDVSGGTTLTVSSATLISISLTPPNPHVPRGTTQQFSALGTFSDGTTHDVTSSITWSSSNTAVATVDINGLATALTPGITTITATSGTLSANTTLAVT